MRKLNIIFIIFGSISLSNCNFHTKSNKEVFVLQFTNDSLLNVSQPQKIELNFMSRDSFLSVKEILIESTDSKHTYEHEYHFVRRDGCLYERKLIRSLDGINTVVNSDGTQNILAVDSTTNLCFCNQKADTFLISTYDTKNINQLQGLYDYWYHIKRINRDLFMTCIGHCHDHRFGRMYFYDKQYNLTKIIEIGRGKYCEYVNIKNKDDVKFQKSYYLLYRNTLAPAEVLLRLNGTSMQRQQILRSSLTTCSLDEK